jgi:hypothetical protein
MNALDEAQLKSKPHTAYTVCGFDYSGKCFNKHTADADQGTERLPGQGFNIEKRMLPG